MNKEDQSKKIILHLSVISVKVQDNAITSRKKKLLCNFQCQLLSFLISPQIIFLTLSIMNRT